MGKDFCSKRKLKFFGISLFLSFSLFEINSINNQIKSEKNLVAATEKDIFLYRQMGASSLCIASKAKVDFKKGLGIASATFANVISGKHGGVIQELGDEKLNEQRLYNSGTFQIVGSALKIFPESIPKEIKNDYEKRLKQLLKDSKK